MEFSGRGNNEAEAGMDTSIGVFASVVPVRGGVPLSGRVNYLAGNDPGTRYAGVPLFVRVEQDARCPGVAIGCLLQGDGPAQREQ